MLRGRGGAICSSSVARHAGADQAFVAVEQRVGCTGNDCVRLGMTESECWCNQYKPLEGGIPPMRLSAETISRNL